VAYEIAQNVDIYWLDITAGILGVSDAQWLRHHHQPRG